MLFTGRAALFAGIDWTMLLWMAIGGVLLTGYTITFYNGLQKIKASVATSILTLGMAVTALLSALFLDKSLNAQQLLGILLMIVGVIFVSKIVRRFIKSIIFRKKKPLTDYQVCLFAGILITAWPLTTNGNFFNNWLMIVYSLPVGFYLQSIYSKKSIK